MQLQGFIRFCFQNSDYSEYLSLYPISAHGTLCNTSRYLLSLFIAFTIFTGYIIAELTKKSMSNSSLSNCLLNLIIYRASIKSNLKNYSVFVIFFEAVLYNIKVGKLLSLFFFTTNYSPNDNGVTFLSFTQGALFAVIQAEELTGVIIQRRKFL